MAQFGPGTFVLYRELESEEPPALAIVFGDDDAPKNIREDRPPGSHTTLVFLTDEPHAFRWAPRGQISTNLQHKYETVQFMKAAGMMYEYWRTEVVDRLPPSTFLGSRLETTKASRPAVDEDSELKEAIRVSREEFYGVLPPSPPSSASQQKRRRERTTPSDTEESDEESLYAPRLLVVRTRSSLKRSRPSRLPEDVQVAPTGTSCDNSQRQKWGSSTLLDTGNTSLRPSPRYGQRNSLPSNSSLLDDLRGFNRSTIPTKDDIEGDLSESKEFVQVSVGDPAEIFMLPKPDVWNRPYFQDERTGINYFDLNDQGMWVLKHPKLATMSSEDFGFIAEYLGSGDFGHRFPENEEQIEESFGQCISTWVTAELLGMNDLLDDITEKMEHRISPWPLWDVMAFACYVYGYTSVLLPAHDKMKALLADSMAEHYWIYIDDEHLSGQFLERLRELPELERDIQGRRFPAINPQVGLPEDDDDE